MNNQHPPPSQPALPHPPSSTLPSVKYTTKTLYQTLSDSRLHPLFLQYSSKRRVLETIEFIIAVNQYEEQFQQLTSNLWTDYCLLESKVSIPILNMGTKNLIMQSLPEPTSVVFTAAKEELAVFLSEHVLPKFLISVESQIFVGQTPNKIDLVYKILKSEKMRKKFIQTSKKHGLGKVVKFWIQITKYEDIVFKEAERIYQKYISSDAPTQVNISGNALKALQMKMASLSKNTFLEVKKEVLNLIVTDVLPGFYEDVVYPNPNFHNYLTQSPNPPTSNTSVISTFPSSNCLSGSVGGGTHSTTSSTTHTPRSLSPRRKDREPPSGTHSEPTTASEKDGYYDRSKKLAKIFGELPPEILAYERQLKIKEDLIDGSHHPLVEELKGARRKGRRSLQVREVDLELFQEKVNPLECNNVIFNQLLEAQKLQVSFMFEELSGRFLAEIEKCKKMCVDEVESVLTAYKAEIGHVIADKDLEIEALKRELKELKMREGKTRRSVSSPPIPIPTPTHTVAPPTVPEVEPTATVEDVDDPAHFNESHINII